MPKFTLIKHPEHTFDSEVTVTFEGEVLDVVQAHVNDFLKASGFEIPDPEVNNDPFRLNNEDFVAKTEDWMWDDAFHSKFMMNDGPVGSAGNDVIQFPTRY